MNYNFQSNNYNQINYNQLQNNNPLGMNALNNSIFDVLCENCYDILGHPKGNYSYSVTLGYYCLSEGRLTTYFRKMQNKYGQAKLKLVMTNEEKNIYNRLCTCGRCRKCLSNYI